MPSNLAVEIAGIKMKNPVMTASGTFGSGREYSSLLDINKLGAIVVKSVTFNEIKGNKPPRICETASGILNSIGLQNKGVDYFINMDLPFLKQFDVPVIVSVAGYNIEQYVQVVTRLEKARGISGIELNVSCPNIKNGGMEFGNSLKILRNLVGRVRTVTDRAIIVKLSPNIADICKIAEAAIGAGANAISLINSIPAMSIDIDNRKPKLGNVTGGLTGPAIKPIALKMVWEVANRVEVPVIGIGGIMTTEDAIEFFLAGASAVAIGTANLVNPKTTLTIIAGLRDYLKQKKIDDINELRGMLII